MDESSILAFSAFFRRRWSLAVLAQVDALDPS
jgi:hypothetical protein